MKQAEILTIGTELTVGRTQDTNANWVAKALSRIGIAVRRITSIPDDVAFIRQALDNALAEVDVVIITGGLGPTKDDITKTTLTRYFNLTLELHEPTKARLEERYKRLGRVFSDVLLNQAMQPTGADVLDNPVGSAPGMRFLTPTGQTVVSLPGVPYEMQALMNAHVLPDLTARYTTDFIALHTLRTAAVPESILAKDIEDIENGLNPALSLAYNPSLNAVDLRLMLTCPRTEKEKLVPVFQETLRALRNRLGLRIYGEEDQTLEGSIGEILKQRGLTLALAESCTGGAIAARIVAQAGASAYLKGGIVAYSNHLKVNLLAVNQQILDTEGAVSETVARQMAEGARTNLGADIALSVTGIAGPDGGSEAKPVGTVWIGYADAKGSFARHFVFEKDRSRNIQRSVVMGLNLLRLALLEGL